MEIRINILSNLPDLFDFAAYFLETLMIYLDNAATSFPKPAPVGERMFAYITQVGATINRSVYGPAREAGLVTLRLRERLCRLLGFHGRPTHAILTPGCTMGLNLVLQGWLQPGDHCIVSAMEHNAVMRPLVQMGVDFDRIPCDATGLWNPEDIIPLIRPNTRLLVMAHGSNVSGAVQDAEAVGQICKRYGIPFVLDAAQTAGHVPVDFERFGCSALAVPGHKGLLGPSGIGAVILAPEFAKALQPLVSGGTGSASHTELQPSFLPDKFESGTPNLPGIYGWEAGLQWLEEQGISNLRDHELRLMQMFIEGIQRIPDIKLHGPTDLEKRVGVFSLDFVNQDNAMVGDRLEQEFGILTRCGLHCAPNAHRTLGTYPQGTVRFSLGWSTTEEEIRQTLHAIDACR